MATQKIFLLAAIVVVLLITVCASPIYAQQKSVAAPPAAEAKVPAKGAAAQQTKTEVPVPPAATPYPAEKNPNERLPFMAETDRETHEQAPSSGGLLLRTL